MFTIYLSAHCHVLRKLQHAIVSLISFDVIERGFYLDFISIKFSYFVKICSRGCCISEVQTGLLFLGLPGLRQALDHCSLPVPAIPFPWPGLPVTACVTFYMLII